MVARGKRLCAAPGSILPTQPRALKARSKNQPRCCWSLSIAISFQHLRYSMSRGSLRPFRAGRVIDKPRGGAKALAPGYLLSHLRRWLNHFTYVTFNEFYSGR